MGLEVSFGSSLRFFAFSFLVLSLGRVTRFLVYFRGRLAWLLFGERDFYIF